MEALTVFFTADTSKGTFYKVRVIKQSLHVAHNRMLDKIAKQVGMYPHSVPETEIKSLRRYFFETINKSIWQLKERNGIEE